MLGWYELKLNTVLAFRNGTGSVPSYENPFVNPLLLVKCRLSLSHFWMPRLYAAHVTWQSSYIFACVGWRRDHWQVFQLGNIQDAAPAGWWALIHLVYNTGYQWSSCLTTWSSGHTLHLYHTGCLIIIVKNGIEKKVVWK